MIRVCVNLSNRCCRLQNFLRNEMRYEEDFRFAGTSRIYVVR